MMNKASHFQALTDLGSGPLPRAQYMTVVAGAVLLYGRNNCTDLNELRCEKATLENIAAGDCHLLTTASSYAYWLKSQGLSSMAMKGVQSHKNIIINW